MKSARLFEIIVGNRDRTTLRFVANCKLDATMAYQEWIKEQNDPEFASEYMDFDVNYIGEAYLSEGLILKKV